MQVRIVLFCNQSECKSVLYCCATNQNASLYCTIALPTRMLVCIVLLCNYCTIVQLIRMQICIVLFRELQLELSNDDEMKLRHYLKQLLEDRSTILQTIVPLESINVESLSHEYQSFELLDAQKLDMENAVLMQELMSMKVHCQSSPCYLTYSQSSLLSSLMLIKVHCLHTYRIVCLLLAILLIVDLVLAI